MHVPKLLVRPVDKSKPNSQIQKQDEDGDAFYTHVWKMIEDEMRMGQMQKAMKMEAKYLAKLVQTTLKESKRLWLTTKIFLSL